ncbi:sensor histidine kinase [Vibrio hannami]|uniref:ATP-binding protein n=1 Tax=Vibrio hannami TaxID=2717094 RepID=UPI00240F260A|nr:sensor histidine kinase [Vibrio hannami]MDG3085609.1 sensor histidine kinase [Vibrio hannami]
MSDISNQLMDKVKTGFSFRKQVFMLIFALMLLQLGFMGSNFHSALVDTLEDQVGTRALIQAQEIASDPELIAEVRIRNVPEVEKLIGRLLKISDASFIVVGDTEGIRLAHPDKEKVGFPMQGGDNAGALERGESYISIREGSLGYGVRGKTPIVDVDGSIIGVVSVGYLLNRFDQWLLFYAKPFAYDVIIVLLLTLVGAWFFSSHIKSRMNGMEPSEIALALYLQKSILKSVYEGVIAIDKQGKILTVNKTALAMIGTDKSAVELKNRSIVEYISPTRFLFQAPFEQNLKDEIVSFNGNTYIANRVAMIDNNQLIGWVVSFRRKDDINSLTAELTQIRQYTDNLRVLRHEHANKLSMISGMIEIGEYDAALSLINRENNRKQQLIDFVSSRINDKQIAGLLIGKSTRSRELGLELEFDPTCRITNIASNIDINELSAVIGNLLDNAFEATLKNPDSNKVVSFLITDAGKELVIEVADNGCGIDPELADSIFTRGVTSKSESEGHGIGLYLINHYVNNANGVIMVDDAEPKGTIFSIFIPNNGIK